MDKFMGSTVRRQVEVVMDEYAGFPVPEVKKNQLGYYYITWKRRKHYKTRSHQDDVNIITIIFKPGDVYNMTCIVRNPRGVDDLNVFIDIHGEEAFRRYANTLKAEMF